MSEDGDVAAMGAGATGWLAGVLDREQALATAPMMISGTMASTAAGASRDHEGDRPAVMGVMEGTPRAAVDVLVIEEDHNPAGQRVLLGAGKNNSRQCGPWPGRRGGVKPQ